LALLNFTFCGFLCICFGPQWQNCCLNKFCPSAVFEYLFFRDGKDWFERTLGSGDRCFKEPEPSRPYWRSPGLVYHNIQNGLLGIFFSQLSKEHFIADSQFPSFPKQRKNDLISYFFHELFQIANILHAEILFVNLRSLLWIKFLR